MSNDAVHAFIDGRGGDDDEFTFGFGEALRFVHQRVMKCEEGPKFFWSGGKSNEDVGNKP